MNKKNRIGRSMLNRLQFEQDGYTIGRLQMQARYLARQLAVAGARPCYPPNAGQDAEDVAALADEWLAAAERFSAEHYGRQATA